MTQLPAIAAEIAVHYRRGLTLLSRNKASLVSAFVVPTFFFLCLYGVFHHAADQAGMDYTTVVLGGCLFQGAMFSAAASAMVVARDIDDGFVMRVAATSRSLVPYAVGRLLVDCTRALASSVVLILIAMLLDYRPTVAEFAVAIGVTLLVSLVLALLADSIVFVSKRPVAVASGIQSFEMLALLYSTAFVPADALSGTTKTLVTYSPVSPLVELIRYEDMGSGRVWTAIAYASVALLVGTVVLIQGTKKKEW